MTKRTKLFCSKCGILLIKVKPKSYYDSETGKKITVYDLKCRNASLVSWGHTSGYVNYYGEWVEDVDFD